MFGIFPSSRHGLSAAVPRPAAIRSRDAASVRSRDAATVSVRSSDAQPTCLLSRDARPTAAHAGGDSDDLTGPWEVEHGPVRLLQRHGHL